MSRGQRSCMTALAPRVARPSLLLLLLLLLALAVAAPAARADDALRRVRAKNEILIATDATYPPFEFVENDALTGFDIELGKAIGEEIGVPVRFESLEWAGVLASVETGKCDLAMSGITITEERKKGGYAFSRPYFLSGQVIVRRKGDARVSGPDAVVRGGLTAAVQQETTGQFALEKRGMPADRIHRFDALQDALLDVRNGKSDAAVGDLPALAEMLRKGYAELEILPGDPFVDEYLGIAAHKDSRDLVAAVNRALERLLVSGRYAALYEKWMQTPLPLSDVAKLAAAAGEGTPIPAEIAARVAAGATEAADADGAPDLAAPPTGSSLAIRPDVLRTALPVLLRGAVVTLELTTLTLLIGVPLGLLIALARISGFALLRLPATGYVEAVRGTPLLMQIYVIYFVLPAVGVSVPPFVAGVMALSLNAAAYVSEIFRAGIESIDSGQMEAARALGMTGGQAMRHVLLPQTVRRVLPPLTNEAVALLKDSSLVSVVALAELMRRGKELAGTSAAPTTIFLAVALLYLAMTLPLTSLVRYLEFRWQPVRRTR